MEDVPAGTAVVVQGEEAGAATEKGDGITTDAVVLVTVSAGAAVEIV